MKRRSHTSALFALLGLVLAVVLSNRLVATAIVNYGRLQELGVVRLPQREIEVYDLAVAFDETLPAARRSQMQARLRAGLSIAEPQYAISAISALFSPPVTFAIDEQSLRHQTTRNWINLAALRGVLRPESGLNISQQAQIKSWLRSPLPSVLFPVGADNLERNVAIAPSLVKEGYWTPEQLARMQDIWLWQCGASESSVSSAKSCSRLAESSDNWSPREFAPTDGTVLMVAGTRVEDGRSVLSLESLYWVTPATVNASGRPYVEFFRPERMTPQTRYRLTFRYLTRNVRQGHALVALMEDAFSPQYVFVHEELAPTNGMWKDVEFYGVAPPTLQITPTLILRNRTDGTLLYDRIVLEPAP